MCQVLNIIILCPIICLDYFWCIKYQYKPLYMKIGKRNGKKKRKKDFLANWARGGFRPSRGERACARAACGPTRPANVSSTADGAVGAGPRASEEGGRC
jgi:hypothetical protein